MDYVSRHFLHMPGQHIHRNQRRSKVTSQPEAADLPLFEALGVERGEFVEKVKTMYSEDMKLFGYVILEDPITKQLQTRSEQTPDVNFRDC